MRKIITLFFIITLGNVVIAAPLFAAELDPGTPAHLEEAGTPMRKAQRGVLNVVFSPLELSQALREQETRETALPSWFEGSVRGLFKMVGRATIGVLEIATFPFGGESVLEPEFAWQYLDEN